MTFKDRADYIRKTFAPETDQQRRARPDTKGDISIYPEEGKFLQTLIRLGNIKKIIEIGTFTGYSALWMAEALPDDGLICTIEKDADRANVARKNLAGQSKVRLMEGDALHILNTLKDHDPFDMAFIDADKLNYCHYLDWAEKHIRKGGLIVGDNTFLFDATWKDGPVDRVRKTARTAIRTFNIRLADPVKYTGILLNTPEGMTVAVKNF